MEERATALKIKLSPLDVTSVDEFETAITAAKAQAGALVVLEDGIFVASARRMADLSLKHRVPGIAFTEYAEAGGLLSYGVDFPYVWRQSTVLVDKILKGAKPGDIPIERASKFETIVNLKTAKTLGIKIPDSIMLRADKVIE